MDIDLAKPKSPEWDFLNIFYQCSVPALGKKDNTYLIQEKTRRRIVNSYSINLYICGSTGINTS